MSVLKEYSSKLYSRLLSNYAVRDYWDQPVYLRKENNKYIPASWLSDNMLHCESLANFIASMQSMVLEGRSGLKDEVKFFVSAAHIMFIPFGQAGYDYLKEVVAKKFDGKEIGEFLYEQFEKRSICPLNGSLLEELNQEQKEYIKDFFINFDKKDEIDCSNPKDIATLACRLYFALYGIETSLCQIRSLTDKYMKAIEEEIMSPLYDLENEEIYNLKISDYIDRIPKHEPLNRFEEKFILEKFDL